VSGAAPLPADRWLMAEAPWPQGVQAGMTLRTGGVSVAPWDSWNLGDHVGDNPLAVASNRERLTQALAAGPVFCQQVHGTDVVRLVPGLSTTPCADAAWTAEPALACAMMVADCLPLLLASPDGASVAAVHAGWRGLAGHGGRGVLEALCEAWPPVQGRAGRRETVVWLGPCIGPQAFEVGDEVRQAFVQADPGARACFQPLPPQDGAPKFLADLPALARRRLAALGFDSVHGNDGSPVWCTVSDSSRFFSHRRDHRRLGSTGRMAACIWRG